MTELLNQVDELTDDQALLLHWVNMTLETEAYREYPALAEVVALTVSRLASLLTPGPLRDQLGVILGQLQQNIRDLRTLMERRTH